MNTIEGIDYYLKTSFRKVEKPNTFLNINNQKLSFEYYKVKKKR